MFDAFTLTIILIFAAISLFASFMNGALGYGFSSLAVPLAVLFFPNKVLNPAFVIVELLVNSAMLLYERSHLRHVIPRTLPVIISILPGVLMGSFLLSIVNAQYVKIFLYVFMLPLILLQAAGLRKPIKSELAVKFPFGVTLGLCYSLTTISGPPLALFWNNQGLAKNEFRAAVAQVRFAETAYTAVAYLALGLYNPVSTQLTWILLIPMIIGLPIGAFSGNRLDLPTFRRICMSFDAWIVGYGLSSILTSYSLGSSSYLILVAVIIIDAILLYYFFTKQRKAMKTPVSLRLHT